MVFIIHLIYIKFPGSICMYSGLTKIRTRRRSRRQYK
ncbi:glycosyl transferase family 1 [Neisseria meningitidis]|nr:glycosyl transferase family 1 [Neisseria meningitidis]MBG8580407.1 glycosyl transferase family 1 [Neisseria meningitidis]MBG8585243.1 glycosyl transferase family 1 [Neisseria meningitidis]MBG8602523.1 glycosyl transferase family 1 [Neisseria meningitidis]MBG8648902.1 glycosyl transferase family 1 [Neisseria meningitidis]